MLNPPLIVLSLDGLAAASLGCYGSSWNETPSIDRLAATGCVWDRFLATSDRPEVVFRDWTDPASPWCEGPGQSRGSLVLVTDSDSEGLQTSCFDEVVALPTRHAGRESRPATDVTETQFGQLVAAAIERLAGGNADELLWIHSGFLTRCWDAPRDLMPEDEVLDEFSVGEDWASEEGADSDSSLVLDSLVELLDQTQPPDLELMTESHPDLVTAWMKVYGCQVRLVDLLLDVLLEAIAPADVSFVLVGTSGFRLGQGGRIGHRPGPLRSPDIHLPLIVNRGGPLHVPHLTSSAQFGQLLQRLRTDPASCCSPEEWSSPTNERPPIQIRSDRAIAAVCNPNWFYVRDADESEHLFLKPDDVDDFNDVGRLRGDILETFRGIEPSTRDGGAEK